MKKLNKANSGKGDNLLLISVALLSIIGTIFIYSASSYTANKTYSDSFYFVKKQVIGIALGIIVMILMANFDYNKLHKFTIYVSIIAFVSLILVFIPKIGVENYGARRWIGVGVLTLQPSEISKFALILFCAHFAET